MPMIAGCAWRGRGILAGRSWAWRCGAVWGCAPCWTAGSADADPAKRRPGRQVIRNPAGCEESSSDRFQFAPASPTLPDMLKFWSLCALESMICEVADREGFEPSEPLRVHMISNHAHSTTLAPVLGVLAANLKQSRGGSIPQALLRPGARPRQKKKHRGARAPRCPVGRRSGRAGITFRSRLLHARRCRDRCPRPRESRGGRRPP